MDRDLAVELERDASPHYYHGEDGDSPGGYYVSAAVFERVMAFLRGESDRRGDW